MIKKFRASHAALAVARKIDAGLPDHYSVDLSFVAKKVDEELAHSIPLLHKLEKALEKGADLQLNRAARMQLDIDLSDVRTVLHSIKPVSQEINVHE